jgi:hypothetical protein
MCKSFTGLRVPSYDFFPWEDGWKVTTDEKTLAGNEYSAIYVESSTLVSCEGEEGSSEARSVGWPGGCFQKRTF